MTPVNYKSNLTVGSIYTASQTELIVSNIAITSNGGRGKTQIVLLDQDDNETVLAAASVHLFTNADTVIPVNSASALVKQGQRYKVTEDETSPSVEVKAYYEAI